MALYLGDDIIGKVLVVAQSSGGTDTSDATLSSNAQMLSPYTAYSKGVKYTGSIVTRSSANVTASGKTVTVQAGYYASQVTRDVSTVTLATPTISVNTSTGLITATQTQSAGYVSAGTTTATSQLSVQAATTITPGSSSQTAVAANKYTTGAVTVAAVTASSPTFTNNGTYTPDPGEYYDEVTVSVSGGGTINNQNKSVTPTESEQSVTYDSGYTGLGTVTVGAISSTYVGTGIARKDSSNLSASGATVTAPAGYYASDATKSVASGSATAPATISGTSATLSTGTNTITLSKTISVTPSVTAGYVSSGTAGNSSVSLTASVTTQAAQTLYPSSTDQTISSGRYLTGTQTFKAVTTTNLTASNIKSGVVVEVGDSSDSDRILSVTGTYTGGGGSGLTYESGTYTPTADTARPTISFTGSHTSPPMLVLMSDTSSASGITSNSNTIFCYENVYEAFSSGYPYSTSATRYGVASYTYRSSNGSTTASVQVQYSGTGTSTSYASYWVTNSAFYPYSNSTSRYWRKNRNYKWVAVWAP